MSRASKPKPAKKPARKPRKPAKGKRAPEFSPEDLRRAATVGLSLTGLVAVGVGGTLGLRRLEARANGLAQAQLVSAGSAAGGVEASPPIVFRWPVSPGAERTWIPQAYQLWLLRDAAERYGDADPLDGRALRRIGEWLEGSGWFVGTPSVTRDPEGRVVIDGDWRTPFAAVRWREGGREVDRLLSARGYPMPVVYDRDGSGLPFISGVGIGPADPDERKRYAGPWPDPNVQHAAKLLHLLSHEWFFDQIAGIDIERDNRDRLNIITKFGTRIVWGGPLETFNPGENSDERKLAFLRSVHQNPASGGRVDAGQPLLEIWGPEVMIDDLPRPTPDPVPPAKRR